MGQPARRRPAAERARELPDRLDLPADLAAGEVARAGVGGGDAVIGVNVDVGNITTGGASVGCGVLVRVGRIRLGVGVGVGVDVAVGVGSGVMVPVAVGVEVGSAVAVFVGVG